MQGDGSAYFLYHSIGQYPGKEQDLAQAMAGFAASWAAPNDLQWGYALGKRQGFIDRWRDLIGAAEGTLTTTENVTAALYAVIGALPAGHLAGRKLLVAGDCFPSLHFLLAGLAPRFGFTLKTVPLRPGAHWVEDEDVIAAWGPDVALALLTWVSSISSHRSDIATLVAHGRAQGSLIGVDVTQAVGLLPFDVNAPAVDFAVSTSLKWMCGTPGAGMLYVAPALIASSQPEFRGWFSQPNPFSWDLDKFAYAPDIRRYDNGTPSVLSAVMSLPAMEWHAAQDKPALLAHTQRLGERLMQAMEGLDVTFATPRAMDQRGGSVMVKLPPEKPAAPIIISLRAQGIAADARDQLMRFSPGNMTTDDGVDRLIAALEQAVGSR
jgi:kynureninase